MLNNEIYDIFVHCVTLSVADSIHESEAQCHFMAMDPGDPDDDDDSDADSSDESHGGGHGDSANDEQNNSDEDDEENGRGTPPPPLPPSHQPYHPTHKCQSNSGPSLTPFIVDIY
jgi:hypothetical protein